MLLLIHICAAIISLLSASAAFFRPGPLKLWMSYSFTAVTLATGTYLVISRHARILSACLSGLLYIGLVFAILAGAKLKLVSEKDTAD